MGSCDRLILTATISQNFSDELILFGGSFSIHIFDRRNEQRSKCSKNRTRRRLFRGLRPAFKSPWSCPGGRRSSHQGLQKKTQTKTIFPIQRSSGIWKHYSQQEKIQ